LVVFNRVDDVAPVIDALMEGGIGIIEIALRTPSSLSSLEKAAALGSLTVGAGTITKPTELAWARNAGATFGVSPATSPGLLGALAENEWPFIPGAMTISEAMTLRDNGFQSIKLYPFNSVGGLNFVASLRAVLPDLTVMPSGGVDASLASELLRHNGVFAVSGSWIAPPAAIASGDWKGITARALAAREASSEHSLD